MPDEKHWYQELSNLLTKAGLLNVNMSIEQRHAGVLTCNH